MSNLPLSEELAWRGFVNQTTFTSPTQLDGDPITFYFGVDPSSDSMQVGNLAAAMMVRHFIDHGHKAILLVGGATGIIGDPDGKTEEREAKSLEEVARNKAAIAEQYKTVFAGKEIEIVDNYDWFKDFGYIEFLRTVGKHVPMRQMLGREFVQSRLGEDGAGISYAEFSYSLIQGFDFVHLYREKGATLQLCGADQWGNSIAGVDLIRRMDGGEAHVWSTPLVINRATGKKFGKSEAGAVWLDPAKTSPYQFYQFWLNVDDQGAPDYLKIYTLLTEQEINDLNAQQAENPGARPMQKRLAYEVTRLIHGQERTESVQRVTDALFGGADFAGLSPADLELLAQEIPTTALGQSVIDTLLVAGVQSTSEAARLISGGGVSVNGVKITENSEIDHISLVKKGKNTFILVR